MIATIFGWIGTLAYALHAIPQVILCVKKGNARGMSRLMGTAYLCGSFFSLLYALWHNDAVLTINFAVGTVAWLIINKYVYFERRS